MANSIVIGSTLIASAAFAAPFAVSAVYKPDLISGKLKPGLSLAFKAFVLMSSHAFLFAIAAVAFVMEGAISALDPAFRSYYVTRCISLTTEAIKSLIVAFALGVLVMMISVLSEWRLACLVCLVCCVVPVIVQQHWWPKILIQKALIRYLGIKRYFLVGGRIFLGNIAYGIIVLLVLFAGRSSNADLVEHVVLTMIIVILLFISYPFCLPFLHNTKFRKPNAITIIIDRILFLIIALSLCTYLVLFFPFHHLSKSPRPLVLLVTFAFLLLSQSFGLVEVIINKFLAIRKKALGRKLFKN